MTSQTTCCLLLLTLVRCSWTDNKQVVKLVEATLTFSPDKDVKSGTTVYLNCNVRISTISTDTPSLQYSFYKDTHVTYAKNSSSKIVPYRIENVRAFHSGTYHCIVKSGTQKIPSEYRQLNVTGLQTPFLSLSNDKITEGEEVTLNCSAPNEEGSLDFTFFINSIPIKVPLRSGTFAEMNHIFNREANVSCKFQLVNQKEDSPISNVQHIVLSELLPKPIIIVHPSQNVTEGDRVTIECHSNSSLPDVEVHLQKDSKILSFDNVRTSSSFIALFDENPEYLCQSEAKSVRKSTEMRLNVQELFSRPLLKAEASDLSEGQTLRLNCSSVYLTAKRLNEPITYTFQKYQQNLISDNQTGIYTISGVSNQDEGNYSCHATAWRVRKASNNIYIRVHILVTKPKIQILESSEVIAGHKVHMKCLSDRGSPPVMYTLMRNKDVISRLTVMTDKMPAMFNVTVLNETLAGLYWCEAANRGGSHVVSGSGVNLTVIVPVTKPILTIISGNSVAEGSGVTLMCQVEKGTPPFTFRWFRNGERSAFYSNTTDKQFGVYENKSVGKQHGGKYFCQVTNRANKTMDSRVLMITVTMNIWKHIIIGLCVVILLLLVLFYIIKSKCPPAKRAKNADPDRNALSTLKHEEPPQESDGTGYPGEESNVRVSCHAPEVDFPSSNGEFPPPTDTEPCPDRVPLMATRHACSELRHSLNGVPDNMNATSVEYAELHHRGIEAEQ
uniref:Platelet endothelial cell adhesion molecule n=1 Tax=Erpetoichthys calabaricus TaxID=27687 RepID=A0A8C4TAF6_ERPCA